MKQEVNANLKKSARTQYLPKVNALGGYMWMSREISILNDDQKEALSNLGTNATMKLQDALAPLASTLPAEKQAKMASDMGLFANALNQAGAGIVEGFRTDTRNTMAGAVTATQPDIILTRPTGRSCLCGTSRRWRRAMWLWCAS